MATDSMAAMAPVRNSSAQQRRRVEELGRRGERHGQDGSHEEDDADGRLPALAVEGDAHDRHEQQDAEPAPHAARRQHEEGHRRHVERRSDDEGPGRHAPADQMQHEDHDQQQGADQIGPAIRRAPGARPR